MDKHFRIVVATVECNLSVCMRQLNGVYTQRRNRAHGRVGHGFQGYFKAVIVKRESYLLELVRYVVLNARPCPKAVHLIHRACYVFKSCLRSCRKA